MIVMYDEIKDADIESVEEIRKQCTKYSEMFCVVFNHHHLIRDHVIEDGISSLILGNNFSVVTLADMVLFQKENGRIIELKNRFCGHNTLKLKSTIVATPVDTPNPVKASKPKPIAREKCSHKDREIVVSSTSESVICKDCRIVLSSKFM